MDVSASSSVPHTDYFPSAPPPRQPSVWRKRLLDDRQQLPRFWPVIQNLVIQELRVRYQRSVLGFFWTLLNPLLMLMTLSWALSQFVGAVPNYSLYLFSGMVPWGFMSGSLNECATCIIANEGLIRKIYVPKLVFPLSRILINLVTLLLTLAALFVLLLSTGGARLSPSLVLLPAAVALYVVFTLGMSLAVATANTFFRDCGHLVAVFLQAWYFASPILYRAEDYPPEVQWRFRLNPVYCFLDLFQSILYRGQWPHSSSLLLAATLAVLSLGAGYAIFKSQEDKMVFRL
jgi:ABC-2 type transport system permease protein/lipopolysaccharide transport system permease protein